MAAAFAARFEGSGEEAAGKAMAKKPSPS